jgi:hypothetical protein
LQIKNPACIQKNLIFFEKILNNARPEASNLSVKAAIRATAVQFSLFF